MKFSESSLTTIPALEQTLSLMMLLVTVNELSENFSSMQGMKQIKNFCPATDKIVQQFRDSINSQFIDKCSQAISRENTLYWIKRCLVVVKAMTCNSVKEIAEIVFLSTSG